jgi:hypothetical protein
MNSINLQQRKKVLVKQSDHQQNCTLTCKMINSREGQKHIYCKSFSFMFPSFFRYFVSISCPPFTYFVHYTTFHICYKSIYPPPPFFFVLNLSGVKNVTKQPQWKVPQVEPWTSTAMGRLCNEKHPISGYTAQQLPL